jgi:hypothetical protein
MENQPEPSIDIPDECQFGNPFVPAKPAPGP